MPFVPRTILSTDTPPHREASPPSLLSRDLELSQWEYLARASNQASCVRGPHMLNLNIQCKAEYITNHATPNKLYAQEGGGTVVSRKEGTGPLLVGTQWSLQPWRRWNPTRIMVQCSASESCSNFLERTPLLPQQPRPGLSSSQYDPRCFRVPFWKW